jgi:hypothetical protein
MLRAVTVHADRLHDDDVWSATQRVSAGLARRELRATFCVDPTPVRELAIDISDRLTALADCGHEIAQLGGADRRTDVLDADRDLLARWGFAPAGFVARDFATSDATLAWLSTHGFRYDLSTRDAVATVEEPYCAAGVVQLATTHSVRHAVRTRLTRRDPAVVDGLRYAVVYTYDRDFARAGSLVAFAAIMRTMKRGSVVPAAELCEAVERRVAFR